MAREREIAQKLGALGLQEGAGAVVWRQVIEDALAEHVRARDDIRRPPNHVAYARDHGTALVIVVAVDQVLASSGVSGSLRLGRELATAAVPEGIGQVLG